MLDQQTSQTELARAIERCKALGSITLYFELECTDEFADHPRWASVTFTPALFDSVLEAQQLVDTHGYDSIRIGCDADAYGSMQDSTTTDMDCGVLEVDRGSVHFEANVAGTGTVCPSSYLWFPASLDAIADGNRFVSDDSDGLKELVESDLGEPA
ncbi:MAG TPA: hypothetical protein VFQ88_14005 [Nevskiaceae bacterium]|nr:hypothetical protein [Nevskiaceae bacterium]